jgi:hypothetical protein
VGDLLIGLLVGVAYLLAQALSHYRARKIVQALDRLSTAISKDVNGKP